jgi:hypothetical protein
MVQMMVTQLVFGKKALKNKLAKCNVMVLDSGHDYVYQNIVMNTQQIALG